MMKTLKLLIQVVSRLAFLIMIVVYVMPAIKGLAEQREIEHQGRDYIGAETEVENLVWEYEQTNVELLQRTEEEEFQEREPEKEYIGTFTITFYCSCAQCNGNTNRETASGKPLTDGVTIAVDPEVIPLGETVYIEGYGERIAQDTGGMIKGKHIDMFVDVSHDSVMDLGVETRDVYRIK